MAAIADSTRTFVSGYERVTAPIQTSSGIETVSSAWGMGEYIRSRWESVLPNVFVRLGPRRHAVRTVGSE